MHVGLSHKPEWVNSSLWADGGDDHSATRPDKAGAGSNRMQRSGSFGEDLFDDLIELEDSEVVDQSRSANVNSKSDLLFPKEAKTGDGTLSQGPPLLPTVEEVTDRRKAEEIKPVLQVSQEEQPSAIADVAVCRFCGTLSDMVQPLAEISHFVCRACAHERKDTDGYRLISQTNAMRVYRLSVKDLRDYEMGRLGSTETLKTGPRKLAVVSRPNPRGYGNAMKLFYRFQVRKDLHNCGEYVSRQC